MKFHSYGGLASFLLILQNNTVHGFALKQCDEFKDIKEKKPELVPPILWDEDGTGFEPALVHLGFDIWDVHRVDDFTQTLNILVTFTVGWSDHRLEDYCELQGLTLDMSLVESLVQPHWLNQAYYNKIG